MVKKIATGHKPEVTEGWAASQVIEKLARNCRQAELVVKDTDVSLKTSHRVISSQCPKKKKKKKKKAGQNQEGKPLLKDYSVLPCPLWSKLNIKLAGEREMFIESSSTSMKWGKKD